MKPHKPLIFLLSLFLASQFVACSSAPSEDKGERVMELRSQLDSLRKIQQDLDSKIAKVEEELIASQPDNLLKLLPVQVSKPTKSSFEHYVNFQGKVENKNNVLINPSMGGRVTKVMVKVGDKVRAGQTLAQLETSVYYAQRKELEKAMELADTLYKKQVKLREQDATTEVNLLNAKNQKERLEKQLASLNAQIRMNTITSTIDGVVDQVMVKAGEAAAPGAPAFRVVNQNDVVIQVPIADKYQGTITKGKEVKVFFPDLKDTTTGVISFTSSSIDPINRTYLIEVKLKDRNKQTLLRSNMLAVVKINDISIPETFVVDKNLIKRTDRGNELMVAKTEGDRMIATPVLVELGMDYDGSVVIEKGLTENDLLITMGYQDLVEGDLLKIVKN